MRGLLFWLRMVRHYCLASGFGSASVRVLAIRKYFFLNSTRYPIASCQPKAQTRALGHHVGLKPKSVYPICHPYGKLFGGI